MPKNTSDLPRRCCQVIYIAPLKALVRERIKDWGHGFCRSLGKRMVELTGDYTPDMVSGEELLLEPRMFKFPSVVRCCLTLYGCLRHAYRCAGRGQPAAPLHPYRPPLCPQHALLAADVIVPALLHP